MNHPPKYPHTKHWPASETVHRDDTYHDDASVFVGRRVIVSEKIDGGNTGLFDGRVYARSVVSPSNDGWMAMVKKYHAWKTEGITTMVLNGEDTYGIHSIEYDPVRPEDTFRLFSVRGRNGDGNWSRFSWDDTVTVGQMLDIRVVPVLFDGIFDSEDAITEWFRSNLRQPSAIGGPDREGFVMRFAEGFPDSQWETNACKYVRPKHVQTDQHWRKNWRPCQIVTE